jgi:hypothetical protein
MTVSRECFAGLDLGGFAATFPGCEPTPRRFTSRLPLRLGIDRSQLNASTPSGGLLGAVRRAGNKADL